MSANVDFPWLRRLKVTFSGMAGGGGDRVFESTGKQDSLRITAQIQKSVVGIPGATKIMLWNLSKETRSGFVRNQTKVCIEAGWDMGPRSGLRQCFYGEILNATSQRAGPDIITMVSSISAIEALTRTRVSMTRVPEYPVRDLVLDIARYIPDVTVDEKSIVGITDRIGPGGWSMAASPRSCLDQLGKEHKFSWTIMDGKFQAIGDGMSMGSSGRIIEDPFLIAVNPLLTGPGQYVTAVQWRCTFDNEIVPGYKTTLNSRVSSEHNGTYRVNTVVHNLDCHAPASFTTDAAASTLSRE